MRSFLLMSLVLALILFAVTALSYAHKGVTEQGETGIEMAENLTSPESTDTSVVEQDGVSFETLVPGRVLVIPENEPGAKTPVKFGIRIINNTHKPVRFCWYDTLYPNLIEPNGTHLQLDGGRNVSRLVRESDCPVVQPGEDITFSVDGALSWRNNELELQSFDGFGGSWYFHNLEPGMYKFRFIYQNSQTAIQIYEPQKRLLEGIWTGQVATPFVKFSLVPP